MEKGGRDDGQNVIPSTITIASDFVYATDSGHPCQTEHLQGLVERGKAWEDGSGGGSIRRITSEELKTFETSI
jgi:hypothetical protein